MVGCFDFSSNQRRYCKEDITLSSILKEDIHDKLETLFAHNKVIIEGLFIQSFHYLLAANLIYC